MDYVKDGDNDAYDDNANIDDDDGDDDNDGAQWFWAQFGPI